MVVDSKQESKVIELDIIEYNDDYIRLKSDNISKNISKKTYKYLLNNGLYMTKKDNRTLNTYLGLHRLVACLYGDISNLSIHHIDKNKKNNSIENLVPMNQEFNTSLDSLEFSQMLKIGQEEHKKWIKNTNKKNNSLANNSYLQFEILTNSLNTSIQKIYSNIRKKFKNIQTVRNIINYFYHLKEFIIWLKYNDIGTFKDLNKNVRLYT